MNKYHSIMLIALFSLSTAVTQITASPQQPTRAEMVKNHIRQLNIKLAGVEQFHTVAMTKMLEDELKRYDNQTLADNNLMGQLISSVISTYARTKAEQEARKRTKDTSAINEFVAMWHTEANKRLMNNEPLDAFFNKGLTNTADMYFPQQQPTQQPAYRPAQPQPSAPVVYTPQQSAPAQYVYYAQTDIDRYRLSQGSDELNTMRPKLQTALTERNINRFEAFFLKSIMQYHGISITETQHQTNAFLALFDYELHNVERKLSQEIDPSFLKQGIENTRNSLHPQIKSFTLHQAGKFADILKTLEETVVQNSEIACSVCFETYKGRDKFGTVDEVKIKNTTGSTHQHSICKNCAKSPNINSCPECRTKVDLNDLRRQAVQPNHPANWRP